MSTCLACSSQRPRAHCCSRFPAPVIFSILGQFASKWKGAGVTTCQVSGKLSFFLPAPLSGGPPTFFSRAIHNFSTSFRINSFSSPARGAAETMGQRRHLRASSRGPGGACEPRGGIHRGEKCPGNFTDIMYVSPAEPPRSPVFIYRGKWISVSGPLPLPASYEWASSMCRSSLKWLPSEQFHKLNILRPEGARSIFRAT